MKSYSQTKSTDIKYKAMLDPITLNGNKNYTKQSKYILVLPFKGQDILRTRKKNCKQRSLKDTPPYHGVLIGQNIKIDIKQEDSSV